MRRFRLIAIFILLSTVAAIAQIGGGGITVQGAVTAGHCTSFVSASVIQDSGGVCGGTGSSPGGSVGAFQFNNTVFGGTTLTDMSYSGHTVTFGSTGLVDMSAMSVTGGLKIPTAGGAAPTADSFIAFNSTNHLPVFGSNGSTLTYPSTLAAVATKFLTSFTNTTGVFTQAQPAFTDISGIAQIAQGGTGTATPNLVAGTNVTITGSWPNQTINSTATGAFNSIGTGSGYQDVTEIATPANPSAGVDRLFTDSSAHTLKCITSSGSNCLPAGGTVTSSSFAANQVAIGTNATNITGVTLTTDQYLDGSTGSAPVARDNPKADICSFISCSSPAATDFGAALATIMSTYGSGVTVDLSGLTKNGKKIVYASTDPFANSSGSFQLKLVGGCGLEIRISATWHTPSGGAFQVDGCGKNNSTDGNDNTAGLGLTIAPCSDSGGCGTANFAPQFPHDLTNPVAGTAVAVGPPAAAPTIYATGTVTTTNGSTAVTGSGTTWTAGMVGSWFIPTCTANDGTVCTTSSGYTSGAINAVMQNVPTGNCVAYVQSVNSATSITLSKSVNIANSQGGNCALPAHDAFVLTQVTVSGGSTTYTGTITGGAANAYSGNSFTMEGFVASSGANNVTCTATASTATTIVCATTTQVNETHAGTALRSGSGLAGLNYILIEPNAEVMIWLGSEGNGINPWVSSFGPATNFLNIDMEGLPSGIGLFTTNSQELFTVANTTVSFNSQNQTNPFNGDPIAAAMCDGSFQATGIPVGCVHATWINFRVHKGVGTTNSGAGFVYEGYDQVDAKQGYGINVGLFSTIDGNSAAKLKDGFYLDGIGGGNFTVGACENVGHSCVDVGAVNQTSVHISGDVHCANSVAGVNCALLDTNSVGSTVDRASSTVNTVKLINDVPNSTVITADGTLSNCCVNYYFQPGIFNGGVGTWNTGKINVTANGTASSPTVNVTGNPFTGGNSTTNTPNLYLNNTGAATPVSSWSTNGTQFGINATTGFSGNFMDFHVNGSSSVTSIDASGNASFAGAISTGGAINPCGASSPCIGGTEGATEPTPAASKDFIQFNSTKHCIEASYNASSLECVPLLNGSFTANGLAAINAQLGSGSSWDLKQASAHNVAVPVSCADPGSGTGTVQSCSTTPTFSVVAGDCVLYTANTANTGDITIAVNALGAKHVHKWLGASTLASGDLPASTPVQMCYDGSFWQVATIGNAPGGTGTVTSVDFNVNSSLTSGIFTVSGRPVTSSGTINVALTGNSGGIPYFSSGSILSSSAALAANAIVVGGGAGTTPATVANTSVSSGAITLGTDNSVAGTLQLANGSAAAHTIWSSGATTTNTIQGFAAVPTTGHLIDCTVTSTTCLLHDSGVTTANVVTEASNAAQANTVLLSGGADKTAVAADFYGAPYYIPAANCNNATGGAGWSIPSGGTVTCRAGTNNLGGFITITDTSSTFAQFTVMIPGDWDSATRPFIRFFFSSASDTTNGHTVIPQIKVSCPTATNGTTSDDATFSAAQSSSTVTFGASAVANGFYSGSNVQIGSTQMTGCVANGMMIVQVGRATDTATGNINFYGASLTFPHLNPGAAQAN